MGPPGSLLCKVSPSCWTLSQPPQLLASLHADLPLVSGFQAGAKVRERDNLNVVDPGGHRVGLGTQGMAGYGFFEGLLYKKNNNFVVRKLEKWALKR